MKTLLALLLLVSTAHARYAVVPGWGATANLGLQSNLRLYCVRFNFRDPTLNATQVSFRVSAIGGGATGRLVAMGLYADSDGGSGPLVHVETQSADSGAQSYHASFSTQTLTSGTPYRLCFCATPGSSAVSVLGATDFSASNTNYTAQLQNSEAGVTIVGTSDATHNCTTTSGGGSGLFLPTQTGTLTPSTVYAAPIAAFAE